MNANDVFTRRVMGLDYRVWEAMLLVCFFTLGLYGYKTVRYTPMNDQSCPFDTIAVNGRNIADIATCYVNRYYQFAIQAEGNAIVEWDFRDDTNVEKRSIVSHKFIEEGTYRVKATVNGRCEFEALVEVLDNPFPSGNDDNPDVEIYAFPRNPTVGSSVQFECATNLPSIASYEWKVVNTGEVQRDAVPTFTLKTEGIYEIQLIINGDRSAIWSTKLQVTRETPGIQGTPDISDIAGMPGNGGLPGKLVTEEVSPSNKGKENPANNNVPNNHPGTTKPDTSVAVSLPKAHKVDTTAFMDLLQSVVDQNGKQTDDLYEYLDYRESTKVQVNENKSLIPLNDFCNMMKDKKKKKRKIESVSFKIDDKNSIQSIRVRIPESGGFWDRINPFN